jgi:3-isopropylmalate/(R)-2-methylmalate dehydratase large subunit
VPVYADDDAHYDLIEEVDISKFIPMVSRPGKPHDSVPVDPAKKIKIDSAFIGSCTNGRLEDLRTAAAILKDRKVAPGVVLKIVPATDDIWQQALDEGIIKIFKDAGALVSNAGCGGCANGHVGQNGEGEVTISTGNRNFPGKQGKGSVYLAAPANVAASSVAGYITTPWEIPDKPMVFETGTAETSEKTAASEKETSSDKPTLVEGRTWFIQEDNIDTDMIFHNRYLSITDIDEMGQYALDNLEGYEDFAEKAKPEDIIVTQKNFGSGSSRQQAVDCFKVLGINAILAESFGAIYERNAINAAMPVMQYKSLDGLKLENGDHLRIDFKTGVVENLDKNTKIQAKPFSDVQMDIYQRGGIFK